MAEEKKRQVLIFGKDTWPYTTAAREAYAKKGYDVEYINVKAGAEFMKKMLAFSGGEKCVPVIVEHTPQGAVVTTGYGGTWGV